MRCQIKRFGNQQLLRVISQSFGTRHVCSFLVLVGLISAQPIIAAEAAQEEAVASSDPVLPNCLDKVDLTPNQHVQIKTIAHEYEGSIGKVWKQFSDKYKKMIVMETSLLSAIEDNLTEAQRTHIREQRRKTAQHDKLVSGTTKSPKSNPDDGVAKDIEGVAVVLTPEQEAISDRIQESYRVQMRALSREIQALHQQLLSLEAEKLVAIEKVLTKDQLAQLRTHRQKTPAAPDAAKNSPKSRDSDKSK